MRHPDGYIELRDRGKDIIISGGENISSIEVEQTISAHPAVLECAVVGDPRRALGRAAEGVRDPEATARARPTPRSSRSAATASPRFKCPDAIEFGELPKTSTGKVQKFVLREPEWAGRARRIN